MSKKLICLLLLAAMLVTCAFAEATGGEPSKGADQGQTTEPTNSPEPPDTTEPTTSPKPDESESPAPTATPTPAPSGDNGGSTSTSTSNKTTTTTTYTAPAAPAAAVEITAAATSATATATLDEIAEFEATGEAAVEFFGEDVKAEIAALVPAGFDVSTLKVTEVVALKVPNFTVGQGSQAVTLSFATQYKTGATVVVLVGVKQADGTILWTPVQAKALNGALQVVFPEDLLQAAAAGDAILAVLAE